MVQPRRECTSDAVMPNDTFAGQTTGCRETAPRCVALYGPGSCAVHVQLHSYNPRTQSNCHGGHGARNPLQFILRHLAPPWSANILAWFSAFSRTKTTTGLFQYFLSLISMS
jgi:hypothetical protein